MEIRHRISFSHLAQVEAALDALCVNIKRTSLPGGGHVLHVDMAESDPGWSDIAALAREKNATDVFNTFFSEEEIRTAEWNRLIPIHEKGYPQPEKDHQWANAVYQGRCQTCGVGFQQKAPFHVRREPRLGKMDFMTLYWTYALFAVPRVFVALKEHKVTGYERWPVILHKSNEPSQSVSQVYVTDQASPGLADSDRNQPETCPSCGITKYAFHKRGYMKLSRKAMKTELDIMLTHEWFGSGRHGGHQEILVSQRFSLLLLDSKWKGVELKPIQLS